VRLFVAVWPPAEAVEAVAALDRPLIDGLRWTTPDQWHATLRFLGTVDDPAPVVADLHVGLAEQSAVRVCLGPHLGRFGRRVLHVPVSGLEDLVTSVGAVSVGEQDRDYHGHLTLARARERRGVDLRVFDGIACGPVEWNVDEVTLVRSHLSHTGARYEIIDRVALTPT
jgi:2'-5' RNA ligase